MPPITKIRQITSVIVISVLRTNFSSGGATAVDGATGAAGLVLTSGMLCHSHKPDKPSAVCGITQTK